eukprot:6184942-Pleurochrysis_carterae.AAC.2
MHEEGARATAYKKHENDKYARLQRGRMFSQATRSAPAAAVGRNRNKSVKNRTVKKWLSLTELWFFTSVITYRMREQSTLDVSCSVIT